MKSWEIAISVLTGAAVACSSSGEQTAQTVEPIINGRRLDLGESSRTPAVALDVIFPDLRGPGETRNFLSSGVLIRRGNDATRLPAVVLTAEHNLRDVNRQVDPPQLVRATPGNIVVSHGLAGGRKQSVLAAPPILYPQFVPSGPADAAPEIDLALLLLANDITNPDTNIPILDCEDDDRPDEILCTSANVQTIKSIQSDAEIVRFEREVYNDATFDTFVDRNAKPWILRSEANRKFFFGFFGEDQAMLFGDSGSGCTDEDTPNRLAAIHSKDESRGLGIGIEAHATADNILLDRFCGWINRVLAEQTKLAFEDQVDNDQVPDVLGLTQISGQTFALTIDRTSLGEVSFPVTLPEDAVFSAGAMGNFTGGGNALVVVADGALMVAPFAGGPAPAVIGAPSTNYSMIARMRMNAGSVDDLVAQRASGEVDVFLGGASGLTFTASIDPIPLRLDRDTLSDFAWLDGDSGINTASSIFGQSFRDVVPDTIELTDVKAGVFQSRAGEDAGIADLVTVGVDAAGGGVVIWCESNGNGVICNPALDARFATGRDPTGVEVRDLNADGLDDITVSYADDPTRIILAKPDGFTPLAPAKSFRTGVPFTSPIDLEPEDGQDFETGFIAFDDNAGLVDFTLVDGNGLELGPFLTPFAFAEPFALALGNFNDDGIASALEEGSIPLLDFVVRSGNTLFVMIAGGDGAFSFTEIEAPADMVDFRAADVTGDGVDDLEVIRADGSLSVFPGLPGTAAGIDTGGLNFTGLPTPDGNDGEMLLLSGLGVDTVAATEARFRISVGPGDTAALAQLAVQVFDGDNGGLHQFDEETNVLKTCYRLSADPCGDGNAGSCAGGPIAPTEIVTVSSDVLGDDRWDTIFEGAHSPDASIAGNGLPPFNYELRVFLSQDCAVLPAPGSTIAVATADAFKVRSNGLLSMPAGEFSLVGSDSSGAFGVEQLPYLRDTNYDGTFDIPLAVGSSATEIQLKEADADEIGDATPGVSLGANAEIQYRLLTPNGTSAPLVGAENATATTLVTNPSGNNDGIAALDVETRIHTIGAPTPGTWTWQWEGVKATNAFHVFTPFGSPTTHEVLGARRLRTKLTTAEQPYYWEERSALEAALPVVLGKRYADGRLEGTSLEVGDASTALEILGNSDETPEGELRRQLLVAKLNGARGALLGENITGALVYGTTRTVRETLRAADAAVAGVDLLRDQAKTERLVQLLSSVNLGELTYQQPGVPFPEEPMADLDEDGVVDLKDNCPTVANPAQEDEDDNRIGDACNVLPSVSCVLARSPGEYTAYFGYENPLSQRTIAAGTRNGVTSSAGEREFEQPSEFWGGLEAQAFRVDFSGSEQLTWALEGELAVADRDSVACSGRELAVIDFVPQAALFGAESVVIGDHVLLRARSGLASIVSGGEVSIGGEARVGHVFSVGSAVLGDQGKVEGALVTGGRLDARSGARVLGTKREGAVLRPHSLAWSVDFGTAARPDAILSPNEARALAPGDYGKLVVPAGAVVSLAPGRYRFESLEIARDGVLAVTPGEIVVHVERALEHRGATRGTSAEARLVVGYFGTEPALFDASFEGTIVAPNAALSLGETRNSTFTGAFLARALEVRPTSVVEFAVR